MSVYHLKECYLEVKKALCWGDGLVGKRDHHIHTQGPKIGSPVPT